MSHCCESSNNDDLLEKLNKEDELHVKRESDSSTSFDNILSQGILAIITSVTHLISKE
jgi:hypothetical protein